MEPAPAPTPPFAPVPDPASDPAPTPTAGAPSSHSSTELQDFLLLQRVAQRIGSILDLDVLLEQIVDDVAETFGYNRSGILFFDEARGDLVIAAVRGWTTNYHIKGDRFKVGEGLVGWVAQTGRMHYAPDVLEDPYYVVSEPTTRSEVDIPIRSRGRFIGIFNAQHAEANAFPAHRLQLLEALAGHIGVAIENARLFERERRENERMVHDLAEARAIQTRLFPKHDPQVPGFRITGLSRPCLAVGGDWYDYIPLHSGRTGIVLGDVAGKGPGAALLMTSTRSIVRMYAEQTDSPAAVLGEVNRVLRADLPASHFVTMIYAVLDPGRRFLTIANAGHPPPILADAGGALVHQTRPEFALGISDMGYTEQELMLKGGDRLFLYSDGVVEARDGAGEEYSETRLLRFAADSAASPESLLRDVEAHADGHPLRDDLTIVMVEAA